MTPEHSMFIQNKIGADIMMAMDDVVSSKITGEGRGGEGRGGEERERKREKRGLGVLP